MISPSGTVMVRTSMAAGPRSSTSTASPMAEFSLNVYEPAWNGPTDFQRT
jgi:hypothetical protein